MCPAEQKTTSFYSFSKAMRKLCSALKCNKENTSLLKCFVIKKEKRLKKLKTHKFHGLQLVLHDWTHWLNRKDGRSKGSPFLCGIYISAQHSLLQGCLWWQFISTVRDVWNKCVKPRVKLHSPILSNCETFWSSLTSSIRGHPLPLWLR